MVGNNNNGIMQLCVFHSSQPSAVGNNIRMEKFNGEYEEGEQEWEDILFSKFQLIKKSCM